MADLRKFINPALRPNERIGMFVAGARLGSGSTHAIEQLRAKLSGEIFFSKIEIDIVMPDTSPSGICKMTLNGEAEDCPYVTTPDNKLKITRKDKTEILIHIGDRAYTFVNVTGRPTVGIWPDRIRGLDEPAEPAEITEGAD